MGYDADVHNVVTAGQLPATVATYWRALQPPDADYAISFFFTRPDGAIVGSYADATAALSWMPTRAWRPGEIIRVETPNLAIGRDLGVLVGVSPPGARPDDPAKRLSPAMAGASATGDATPKVVAGARLAELFRFGPQGQRFTTRTLPAPRRQGRARRVQPLQHVVRQLDLHRPQTALSCMIVRGPTIGAVTTGLLSSQASPTSAGASPSSAQSASYASSWPRC